MDPAKRPTSGTSPCKNRGIRGYDGIGRRVGFRCCHLSEGFRPKKEVIMEKVVIIGSLDNISSYQAEEVNKYLDKGWTVKTIHTAATKDYTTAIFVLEKK